MHVKILCFCKVFSSSLEPKYERLKVAKTEQLLNDEKEKLANKKTTENKRAEDKENLTNGVVKVSVLFRIYFYFFS